jgi:PAS domain S-box-containing protein
MADHSDKACMGNAKKGLETQRDELAAIRCLYDLSIGHVSQDNLKTIMNEVLDAAISLSHADMGTIQLLDDQSGVFKIQAHRGFGQAFLEFFDTVHGERGASCGAASLRRERVIVEDVSQSPIFLDTPALNVMLEAGVRACQSTPLISRTGRLVGVFSTHYSKPCREDAMGLNYVDLLAGQAADIIEQVQIHQALQEANRKVNDILESITDAFYAVSADWRLTYINNRCEQWWQRSRDELIGKGLWDIFPDHEATLGYQEHLMAMNERRPVQFETNSPNLNTWMEVSIYPSADGGLSVYFRDISERKRLEELLAHQSADRFRKIFSDSPSMMVIVRMSDDKYVEVNRKFLDTMGYIRKEVLGRTPVELNIRVMENDLLEPALIILRGGGEVQSAEFNLRTKPGGIITVLASIALITFNGEPCRIATMQNNQREDAGSRSAAVGPSESRRRDGSSNRSRGPQPPDYGTRVFADDAAQGGNRQLPGAVRNNDRGTGSCQHHHQRLLVPGEKQDS